MAASADASALVVEPTAISPEFNSILTCVRELYTSFEWRRKQSYITCLQQRLINIAAKQDISLETMERVSLEHAKNYTRIFGTYKYIPYSTIEKKREITSINYISVPYVVYLGEDNTTWVIFRTAASFIPEITPEMMDIIKYLGVVRVYISDKFKKAIPYFPDNVIQIQFDSKNSLTISDGIKFGMPQYLQGFYDLTETYATDPLGYTMRLPATLVELITSKLNTPNLPQNLIFMTYLAYNPDVDLSLPESFFQMIPLSVKSLVLSGFYCNMMDYTMNSVMEYLELDIGHVNGNIIRFDNVNTVRINTFRSRFFSCPKKAIKTYCNFIKFEEFPCHHCNDGTIGIIYKLSNFTVSLGKTVSHLILSAYNIYTQNNISLEILNYLDTSVPNNLECVTITNVYGSKNNLIKSFEELVKEYQHLIDKSQGIRYNLETIINFHTRFPNVKIILE
jgi:hypothetical protein